MNRIKFVEMYNSTSSLGLASKIAGNLELSNYLNEETSWLKSSKSYNERAYCIVNDINTPVKCKGCNGFAVYSNGKKGYRQFCSVKCSNNFNTSDIIKQRKQTQKNIELLFQVDADVSKFDDTKFLNFIELNLLRDDNNLNGNLTNPRNFIAKFGKNCFDEIMSEYFVNFKDLKFNQYYYNKKYGQPKCKCGNLTTFINFKSGYFDFCSAKCSNNDNNKIANIKQKALNPSEERIEKNENNKIQRRKKILESHKVQIEKEYKIISSGEFNSNETIYRLECKECNNIFDSSFVYRRCYNCYPLTFNKESEIAALFDSSDVMVNKRSILDYKRLQLDVYSEKFQLAIEYNGLHWHGVNNDIDDKANKNRHLNKSLACMEKGIKLLQIFENEWLTQPDIWKSIIKNNIGKSNKIYARKCKITIPNKNEVNVFLRENHLQGICIYSEAAALVFDDKIVSIMTIGKSKFNKNYDLELSRFCNILNTTVVGGASKLLKFLLKNHKDKKIISYADLRFSDGDLYRKLGFTELSRYPPNYYYTKGNVLYSRSQFQKHKLKDLLEIFDKNVSESQNMFNNGFKKIWDCGNLVFVKRT